MDRTIYIYALFALLFAMLFMMGCSSQPGNTAGSGHDVGSSVDTHNVGDGNITGQARRYIPDGGSNQGNFNRSSGGRFQNLTDEERTAMRDAMIQKAVSACSGKQDGDACAIDNGRGQTSGTCGTQNENFMCVIARPDFQRSN